MTTERRDQENIKFIQETLIINGVNGLSKWYNQQENYVQDYVINLLKLHALEITELAQTLSGKVDNANEVLNKFTLQKGI
jgi:hypothetical protein